MPLPAAFLGTDFENRITPIAPAVAIFTDDIGGRTNGLSFSGTYKVVFLRVPVRAYGSAAQTRRTSMNRVKTFFGP